ncbi:MAG: DMT family transporter [Acidobacteriota bacterium]|nr:DMT family transporter [Acidobacteriota bacterium]
MNSKRPVRDRGFTPHLALIGVQLMFGTWPIVGKIALRSMSSTSLVALRVVGASVAFMLLQVKLGQLRKIPRRDLAWLVLCSMLGVALNQLLFVKGVALTTVINATLLGTTIPVFTLVVSIAFGYDGISLRRTLGIALAASGVIYLVDPLRADFSAQTNTGNLLIVASSLFYGAYIAVSRDLFKRYGALNVISWMFCIGCLVTVPVGAYALSGDNLQAAPVTVWLAVIYIILVPTVVAFYLNAWALTRVTPSTVATYIYLQPLIAFGLAPLILGETFNSRILIASLLIFAGVGVVTKRGRSRAVKEVAEHPDALAHQPANFLTLNFHS